MTDFNEGTLLFEAKKSLDLGASESFWDETGLIRYYYGEDVRDDCEVYGVGGSKKEKEAQIANLPKLFQLKHIGTTRINDDDLEHITHCQTVTRLHLEDPRVTNFDGLERMPNLTHLNLGSARHVTDLKVLRKLYKLKALSITGSYQQLGHLRDVAKVPNLESLSIVANDFKTLKFSSLIELLPLKNLRLIELAGVRFEDRTLRPMAEFRRLEYISLDYGDLKWYPLADYQYLHENLPKLKNELIHYAATEPEFQKKWKIRA